MLATYIINLIRKIRYLSNLSGRSRHLPPKQNLRLVLLVLSGLLSSMITLAQREIYTWNIIRNGKTIGTIELQQKWLQGEEHISLNSHIRTRLILDFNIYGNEKAIFKDGKLIYSSVYRKLNRREKTNLEVVLLDGSYHLHSKDECAIMPLSPVNTNLLQLYFTEPSRDLKEVYCDNLTEMVPVTHIGQSQYKVAFNKRDYNIFFYEYGKCVRVEVRKYPYKVQLILSSHAS